MKKNLIKEAVKNYEERNNRWFENLNDYELAILWSTCLMTNTNRWGSCYDDEVFNALDDRENKEEIKDLALSIVNECGCNDKKFGEIV